MMRGKIFIMDGGGAGIWKSPEHREREAEWTWPAGLSLGNREKGEKMAENSKEEHCRESQERQCGRRETGGLEQGGG